MHSPTLPLGPTDAGLCYDAVPLRGDVDEAAIGFEAACPVLQLEGWAPGETARIQDAPLS